jgi:predicted outer membrane lipoprotein
MAARNSATNPADGLPAFLGLLWSCAFGVVAALMAPHLCRPSKRYRTDTPPPWKNQDDTHKFTGTH